LSSLYSALEDLHIDSPEYKEVGLQIKIMEEARGPMKNIGTEKNPIWTDNHISIG
jgi:hypothetical protein